MNKNTSLNIIYKTVMLLTQFGLIWLHYDSSKFWLVELWVVIGLLAVEILVMVYTLFILEVFWQRLDSYVYNIGSFGCAIEVVSEIFLVFNETWIFFEQTLMSSDKVRAENWIRLFLLCVNAYVFVWCEEKYGWVDFMKKRTAFNKIDSLPEAKPEELKCFDDVCAICYQEMKSAKVTRCGHYFHGRCLRKWLYLEDICPMCLKIVHRVD